MATHKIVSQNNLKLFPRKITEKGTNSMHDVPRRFVVYFTPFNHQRGSNSVFCVLGNMFFTIQKTEGIWRMMTSSPPAREVARRDQIVKYSSNILIY